MLCPECGVDHHAEQSEHVAELEAQTAVDVAEIHTAAELEHAEQSTERAADDNDTAEAIAEIQADAAVAIAEAEADAAVAIAEAETDAIIAIADAERDDDDQAPAGDDASELEPADAEPAPAAVEIPPQLDETGPAERHARAQTTVSAFRARRIRR